MKERIHRGSGMGTQRCFMLVLHAGAALLPSMSCWFRTNQSPQTDLRASGGRLGLTVEKGVCVCVGGVRWGGWGHRVFDKQSYWPFPLDLGVSGGGSGPIVWSLRTEGGGGDAPWTPSTEGTVRGRTTRGAATASCDTIIHTLNM